MSGVRERDIDLLLVQACATSPDFLNWLVTQAVEASGSEIRCLSVRQSVVQADGESDVELLAEVSGKRVILLIENKVAAQFQPRQAERYAKRAGDYLHRGTAQHVTTILLAPESYMAAGDSTSDFDICLCYESVRDQCYHLAGQQNTFAFMAKMIEFAIERSNSGYVRELDAATTEFWRDYWEVACRHAPALNMAKPEGRPAGSTFVYFRGWSLPTNMSLCHKMIRGVVDLQIPSYGRRLQEFADHIGEVLPPMQLVAAGNSAALRVQVPILDLARDVSTQLPAVISALDAAVSLQTLSPSIAAKLPKH